MAITKSFLCVVGLVVGLGVTSIACSGGGDSTDATYAAGDVGGAVGGDGCNAVVLVGLYDDENCENLVLSYKLDIAKPCSGWTRQTGTTTKDNSGTRFQCYKDRLCYTQYVDSYTCDAQAAAHSEDKESRTTCTKDPTPDIWTKIIGGTENCPDAPSGFQCPLEGATSGLVAACQ